MTIKNERILHLTMCYQSLRYRAYLINENVALKSVFKQILIVNPYAYDSIDDFIDENQELFVSKGWTLNKTVHEDKRRANGAKSHDVLSISTLQSLL